MQKCLFIVLIFLGVDCCAQDSIFSDWTQTTPGGVVGVVHHGKPVYVKAFGLADIAKKIPNDTSLIFDLASITKQFTGMCIALLEEQGKLSVEDDLKKYYPTSQIPPGIKIKNLLDHTSGLRDAAVLAILSGKMNLSGEVKRKYETTEYYMECFMRENDLNFTPGSELSYTNFNYILLGEIVKKVSGRSLPEFADSAIFRPLGMTKTIFRVQPSQKIPGETKGYLQKGKKYKQRDGRGGIVGDHNLLSTVNDMLKWEMNFLNNQLGQKKPGLIEKVTTGSKLNDGSPTNYGYGVWNMPWKGITHIQHGGDDGRETSFSIVFPDQQLIIVVLSNSSNYDATREKAYRIAKVLLKDDLKEPEKPTRQLDTIRLGEDQLKLREGTYTLVNKKG